MSVENRYTERVSRKPNAPQLGSNSHLSTWCPSGSSHPQTSTVAGFIFCLLLPPVKYLSVSLLPGHSLCATMELGLPEGSYLELLNSNADPLHLYHLSDNMDLPGEEETELTSGGSCSLGPLLAFSIPLLAETISKCQDHGQLPILDNCADPPLETVALLPRHPFSQTPRLHPRGFPLPEPDTDTINCDQFSKLLQDMEGDEETREAYANIGKKMVEARKRTERKNSPSLISLGYLEQ